MKQKLWKLGIGITILLCCLQIFFGVENHMGGESFTIESNAASGVKRYYVRKQFYFYNTQKKKYYIDYNETRIYYTDEGSKVSVTTPQREGYYLSKMVIDGVPTSLDVSETYAFYNVKIDYYFNPQVPCDQVYRYYLYNTLDKKYTLLRTETESVLSGDRYTTQIPCDGQKYHVQEIYFNDSKTTSSGNFSYVVSESNQIDVYLHPNSTILQFYDDSGKQVGSQTVFYGEKHKLTDHSLKKPGYEFAGWIAEINGVTQTIPDQALFETPYTQDQVILKLTAQWDPIRYRVFLRYHVDGEEQGATYSGGQYEWEDTIQLWKYGDHPEPVKNASLKGWSLNPDQSQAEYPEGQKLSVETLYTKAKEHNLVDPENVEPVIDLYPTWDMAPLIKTVHVYITRKEALEGKVTPEYLYRNLQAEDPEEGSLGLVTDSSGHMPGVTFSDYQAQTFLTGKAGTMSLSVEARDSGGNVTVARMLCTIVESNGTYLGKTKRVRFISGEYLDTLKEGSIWNQNEQYRKLLEETLEKAGCL